MSSSSAPSPPRPPLSDPLLVGVGLGLSRGARAGSSFFPLRRPERAGEAPPRPALRLRLRARLRSGTARFRSGEGDLLENL